MNTKSTGIAYLVWMFLGPLGGHRFYLDRVGSGILLCCLTLAGGVGLIWWLFDALLIPGMVKQCNLEAAMMAAGRAASNSQVQNVNVVVQAPPSAVAAPASSGSGAPGTPTRPCPACGEDIKVLARLCRFCKTEVAPAA